MLPDVPSGRKVHLWRHKTRKSGAIAKIKIWVESDTFQPLLKAYRKISPEMPISLLIVCWWYFSCLNIQRNSFTYLSYELEMFFFSSNLSVQGMQVNCFEKISWTVYMILINKLQISWRSCFNVLTQKCASFRGIRTDLTV